MNIKQIIFDFAKVFRKFTHLRLLKTHIENEKKSYHYLIPLDFESNCLLGMFNQL